jgi:hypothetical protein
MYALCAFNGCIHTWKSYFKDSVSVNTNTTCRLNRTVVDFVTIHSSCQPLSLGNSESCNTRRVLCEDETFVYADILFWDVLDCYLFFFVFFSLPGYIPTPPDQKICFMGNQRKLTVSLATDNHLAVLGRYHEYTVFQLSRGSAN